MKTGSHNVPGMVGKTRKGSGDNRKDRDRANRISKQKQAELILKNFNKTGKFVYVESDITEDGLAQNQEIFVVETNGFQDNKQIFRTYGKPTITFKFTEKPDMNRVMKIVMGSGE